MYVKVTNGLAKKYSIGQLRRDNPKTAFPKNISDDMLASYNVYPCTVTRTFDYDPMAWRVIDGDIVNVNGAWLLERKLEPLPLDIAQENIRSKRNDLLAECDWTQLADASVDSLAWANYRQALRDIPEQTEFPYNVVWPTKP